MKGLYVSVSCASTSEERASLAKYAQKADQRRRIEAMLALAAVDRQFVMRRDQLDA